MSPIVAAFLRSTVLPAVLAGILLVASSFWLKAGRATMQAWIVALAYVLGSYLLLDRLSIPPHDFPEALSLLALSLAVFVFVAPRDSGKRYALRALWVLGMMALLLYPLKDSLTSMVHGRNLLAFFCLSLGLWSITERSERQVALPSLFALPLISATALSLLLLFSGSASLSQQVTIVCGLLGAQLTLALFRPKVLQAVGLLPMASVFLTMFMVAGHFYLDINPWRLIIVCLPYLILWIRPWLPIPSHPWVEMILLSITAGLPLAYFLNGVAATAGPLY